MGCLFSALKNKEVINICDGAALGCVCDLVFQPSSGQITQLILPGEGIGSLFSAKKRVCVPWNCIERIGDDVILVRFAALSEGSDGCEKGCGKKPPHC